MKRTIDLVDISSDSEDEGLKMAIEASMKSTQDCVSMSQASNVSMAREDEDEDLKEAIRLSLLEGASAPPSFTPSFVPRPITAASMPSGFRFDGTRVYMNRLSPTDAGDDLLSIEDLIKPTAIEVFLTTFSIGEAPLSNFVPSSARIHLAKHWFTKKEPAGVIPRPGNLIVYHPPLLPYGCLHAKLMLVRYSGFLRVVISSANLEMGDWHMISQVIWVQDFLEISKGTPPPPPLTPSGNDFGQSLKAFCAALLFPTDWMDSYDFSTAKAHLVSSVPGYHVSESMRKHGHLRIRHVLSSREMEGGNRGAACLGKTPLVVQSSTVGSLPSSWVSEVRESMQTCPCDACRASHHHGSSSKVVKTKSKKAKGESSIPASDIDFKIVFPSKGCVSRSRYKERGAGTIRMSRKSFEDPDFPRHCLSEYIDSHPSHAKMLSHSKVFLRMGRGAEGSPSSQSASGWVYAGSHNFTSAALGKLQKSGTQLYVANYELGVLLFRIPETSGSAGSGSGSSPAAATATAAPLNSDELRSNGVSIPFRVPCELYGSSDVPFLFD